MYLDENKTNKYAFQTCYGPAISRIFGGMIAIHGDDSGLIFPWDIAPLQVVIVPIVSKKTKEDVLKYGQTLLEKLQKVGIRAKLDDAEKRPGEKYYYWEMKGVPIRLEIGRKEVADKTVTVFRRDTQKKTLIELGELIEKTIDLGSKLTKNIFKRASKIFDGRIQEAETFDEMKEIIENKNAARIAYCTLEPAGQACATEIKDQLIAEVRGRELNDETKPEGQYCLICKNEASVFVVVGRQY
jgi:prolyl-tRNA synthetase